MEAIIITIRISGHPIKKLINSFAFTISIHILDKRFGSFNGLQKQKKIGNRTRKKPEKVKEQTLLEENRKLKKEIKNLKRELKKQTIKNEKLMGKIKSKLL